MRTSVVVSCCGIPVCVILSATAMPLDMSAAAPLATPLSSPPPLTVLLTTNTNNGDDPPMKAAKQRVGVAVTPTTATGLISLLFLL